MLVRYRDVSRNECTTVTLTQAKCENIFQNEQHLLGTLCRNEIEREGKFDMVELKSKTFLIEESVPEYNRHQFYLKCWIEYRSSC